MLPDPFFSLQSLFRNGLNYQILVNRCVVNVEVLLSGSTSGNFKAKKQSLRAPGSTLLSLHLADAITYPFRPRRDKTSQYGCEILGNIRNRGKKNQHVTEELK